MKLHILLIFNNSQDVWCSVNYVALLTPNCKVLSYLQNSLKSVCLSVELQSADWEVCFFLGWSALIIPTTNIDEQSNH